jgi:hypothetical protein
MHEQRHHVTAGHWEGALMIVFATIVAALVVLPAVEWVLAKVGINVTAAVS